MTNYVIEIWNRDFEEPRRIELAGSFGAEVATSEFRGICKEIAEGREQGTPQLLMMWRGTPGDVLVEPANVTKVTISGPGLDLVESF